MHVPVLGPGTGGCRLTALAAQWPVDGSVPAWGRRAWAWARRSVAGIGLPVSPERGERRESSSVSPPAPACAVPAGPAPSRGLPGVFRRLRLPTRRRAGAGRAPAALPGTGVSAGALARSWRCAAAALLLAIAALLALPLQAQAQTGVWSSTLTVRDLGFSLLGCSNSVATSNCSSRLTDDDFTHDSTDYAIEKIFLRTNGQLEIEFDTDLTTATQGLILNVDGTDFAFEDADSKLAAVRVWFTSGQSWSAGDSVSLTLTEPATLSTDATLSALALKNASDDTAIALSPVLFVPTMTSYTADVVNEVTSVTVEPTVNDSNATVAYLNASDTALTDADTLKTGFQTALAVGANTIKVEVTAEDGNTTEPYTITVTREADTAAPSPESAEVPNDGTSVTLYFNEDLDVAVQTLPAAVVNAFTLTAAGVELTIDSVWSAAANALSIRLPTGTAIDQNQTVKVSYDKTPAGADALDDAAGNEVASFTDYPVTNVSTVADTTPPSPESAEVPNDGTSVTLYFNEDLDVAVQILPTAVVNAFTLTAAGVDLTIDSVWSAAANALSIRLPTGTTIYQNQTVTISYDKTVAGADALDDADGNEGRQFHRFCGHQRFHRGRPRQHRRHGQAVDHGRGAGGDDAGGGSGRHRRRRRPARFRLHVPVDQ